MGYGRKHLGAKILFNFSACETSRDLDTAQGPRQQTEQQVMHKGSERFAAREVH